MKKNVQRTKPIKCYYLDGCLIADTWLGSDGYPQIWREGKNWKLSRWVFYNNYGYLPPIVMHTCDNPLCINPLHLIGGDININSQDMIDKGRAPSGLNQFTGGNKLTKPQVREIKTKLMQGISLMSLAKEYNVSKRLVLYIKQGKKWKEVLPLLN